MIEAALWQEIGIGVLETLYMTIVSTACAYVLGLPLGIILVTTDKNGILQCTVGNKILGVIVNIVRSVPFLILLIAIMPFTSLITGSTIGMNATVVPLVVAAAPFIARMVESSLKEVDYGLIEAAKSMGASPMKIICKVLLPEAAPSLLVGAAISSTTILSYSALAGFTGGGGLGDIAVRYGYYKYNTPVMLVTVAFLVIVVQLLQEVGMYIANKKDKRKLGQ